MVHKAPSTWSGLSTATVSSRLGLPLGTGIGTTAEGRALRGGSLADRHGLTGLGMMGGGQPRALNELFVRYNRGRDNFLGSRARGAPSSHSDVYSNVRRVLLETTAGCSNVEVTDPGVLWPNR